MFYEEKIIDGVLCCRSEPNGMWMPATSQHAAAVNAMLNLNDEQRLDVFRYFCKSCGKNDTQCKCWNDE